MSKKSEIGLANFTLFAHFTSFVFSFSIRNPDVLDLCGCA
jgi:hypothetical protein